MITHFFNLLKKSLEINPQPTAITIAFANLSIDGRLKSINNKLYNPIISPVIIADSIPQYNADNIIAMFRKSKTILGCSIIILFSINSIPNIPAIELKNNLSFKGEEDVIS